MATRKLTRLIALFGALAFARAASAQGDLDILLRTVPPIVMIQFDTSGSMSNIVLPPKYITDRGTGSGSPSWVFFNTPTNGSTPADGIPRLAAKVVNGASPTNWNAVGGNGYNSSGVVTASVIENYQRTCQIFNGKGTVATGAICAPGAAQGSSPNCTNDDADSSAPQAGWYLRCWSMPGAVAGSCPANVPLELYTGVAASNGGSCTTINRNRQRGTTSGSTTTFTSAPYTTIVLPNFSGVTGATTDYPSNYLWWMLNEIYNSRTPEFISQDRTVAAKQAITGLVNTMNVDGQDPKVEFGLARYDGVNSNGGYVVVPASLTSKAAILAVIDNIASTGELPASGGTPLSETLVDVARYLAGSSKFGSYPVYQYNTSGGTTGTIPGSPVDSQCQKLFIIAITDGLPTSDANNHYPTAGSTTTFTNTMAGFIDGDGDFTDDVAAKLVATDLRPTIPGLQNAVTYTVGFSLNTPLLQHAATRGTGTYYSSNNATELANSLAIAVNDILLRNTTLTAADVPASRSAFGDGFYTAYFSPGGRRSLWPGHLQAFTVDASLVVTDDANQPAIDPVTDLFYEPRNPHWDVFNTLITDYASRTLYMTRANARATFTPSDPNNATQLGVSFSEEPTYIQMTTSPNPTTAEELADQIVNFVSGKDSFDENKNGSVTDVRPFVLGDIFHSNPIAIGPPLPFLRFESGYGPADVANTFMKTYGKRDRVMYVGANDGMLHAINAGSYVDPNTSVVGDEYYSTGNGKERFGWVPAGVLPNVKYLPKLDTGKKYFVDGASSAADVWIDYNNNLVKDGSDWTTALLTPLREGGESVLALDVTDPAASSGNHGPYPRFMWEFMDAGLGQTWSKPVITRLKVKGAAGVGDKCGANDGDGDCVETWVAIFGGGYRPEGDPNLSTYTNDPNNPTYTTKSRGVYIVNIKDGSILAHLSQDPNSATFSKMTYSISAEPAVLDLNFDGFADVVYLGDLGGQLWKWDISKIGVKTSGVVPTSVWPAGVIFEAPVATVASGVKHYHSIFQSASAAFNQRVLTLSFASGERANLGYRGETDPNNPTSVVGKYDDNNRFWVLKDLHPTGTGAFPTTVPIYEQPLSPATVPLTGHGSLTDITGLAKDPNTADEGYFFRVPDGEKFITNHLIFGGHIATVSYTPSSLASLPPGTCALGGTSSEWAWKLDDGGAALTDPADVNNLVRTRTLGNGAPTDPRISVSKDPNGKIIVRITAQTSTGQVTNPDGGGLSLDPVDMIYWRQNF